MTNGRDVSEHYTTGGLAERILQALEEAGKDLDALTVDDLAPVDAFHVRGRGATEELAERIQLGPNDEVIDVGSGIGGTARYLVDRFGCRVTGVDLTDEFCRTAEALSARVGLADRMTFRTASALELPYDDGCFSVAWTEHVQMNLADKRGFYGEISRVLVSGGRFAFHDLFAGPNGPVHFPVPWATQPSISHLATPDEVRAALADVGLELVDWVDRVDVSIAFFRDVLERVAADGPQPLGLHLVMEDGSTKLGNVLRSLEEGRLVVAQGVAQG